MKNNVWEAVNLAWELGYTIAIPIVVLGFGGAWLDKQTGTSPLFLLSGVVLSVIVTTIAIYKKVVKIIK